MGLGPSKEKIHKILEESVANPYSNEQKYLRLEYHYKENESMEIEEKENENNIDEIQIIHDSIKTSLDVSKINKFPYTTIGTIISQFPGEKEPLQSTCFLIEKNVVVTLASNIDNKNKGGRALSIMTTFSKEKVILDNKHIYIQGEEDNKNKEELNSILPSKLAIILYDENIGNEWIGVEGGKKEDFVNRDKYALFSLELKNQTEQQKYLREIEICADNPFLKVHKGESVEEKNLIKCSRGSPLYYKDYNYGAYVIAILNENLEFQYFDKPTMKFLSDGIYKGKLLKKKKNKDIDDDNIIMLDLKENNFGPADVKYLTDFDLINLRTLDLSDNSIKSTGAFYLSQAKFKSLESLNLDNNKIGDEGLKHIANSFFLKRLNSLSLFHNNISSKGILYLVKAEFINNLILLTLSDNPNIGDTGVKYMKEHKGWSKLSILNLNFTGLTDIAVKYLGEASMPKLKKLNIVGNKFGDNGKNNINALRMALIQVSYKTEEERRRERERRKK